MSIHYFSCSGGPGADTTKSVPGHVMINLCFHIWRDLRVTYCILLHLGREISTHYFACSGGAGTDFTKNAPGDITPNLCFCIRRDMQTRSIFWCVRGAKHQDTIFQAQVGPVQISQKAHQDTLRRICVFASCVIYGSCSTF
jgi:hypothetical protein